MLYLYVSGEDMSIATQSMLSGVYSTFILLALPMFIFAARIMNEGDITDKLLRFSIGLVGHLRGGLAHVNVLTSLIFAGMSGTATSDAAGVGTVLIRMMRSENRFSGGYSVAVTAASATIGPVFPPSLPMIFYSLVSSTSVGALFLGGIVPGMFMAAILMGWIAYSAHKRDFPREQAITWAALGVVSFSALLPMTMPLIMIGGIYGGFFTPTEAAAAAGFYALILSVLVYKAIGWIRFYRIVIDSAKITTIVATIIIGSFLFSHIMAAERVPNLIASALASVELSRIGFFLLINVVLLLLGAFLSTPTILLVIIPLLLPTVERYDINLVHFGVVVVMNVIIGLITPPYGPLLFTLSGLTGVPLKEILREIYPFILVLIAGLFVVVLIPEMSLIVPRFAGFISE